MLGFTPAVTAGRTSPAMASRLGGVAESIADLEELRVSPIGPASRNRGE